MVALLGGTAWAQNVEFSQISDPVSIVSQTTFPLPGDTVSTVTAPDPYSNYRFTHWTVNGTRMADPSGYGKNPAAFVIAGATEAVAHYVPTGQDSDSDGLPDWWELRYFGNLAQAGTDDPDGDGYTNAMEYANGTHPGLADVYEQGGVSRRRTLPFNVDVGVGDPTWPYGGVSRRRSETIVTVQNTAVYAVLREASDPPGVLAQTRIVTKGAPVTLTTPPDPYADYRFTGWLVNGVRYDAATQIQPVTLTVTADTTAVARYVRQADDTDSDGIPDWQEWLLFNSLQYDRTSDPDGDGFTYAVEEQRGTSQIVADQLDQGGLSRRRSGTITVDTTGRVVLRTVSDPATILDDTQYLAPGTVVSVPNRRGESYANYLFSWWDVNGVRQQDASGVALGGFSFTLNATTTVTGHYVNPGVDSDGDGIPDWNEITYYGTLSHGPGDDTDGDGFTYAMELLRGASPRVADTLAQGGVSRRRTELTPVNAVFLPNPPAIGQNAATNITPNSAQLSAVVNPIGSATTVYFRYGLTEAYGQETGTAAIGNGLQALTVTVTIPGLLPGMTYHFQVVATNGQGTSTSEDATFTTLAWDFASWSQSLGIGGPLADDDRDGVSNLAEFAFGLNPQSGMDRALLPGAELVGGRLRLRVTVPTGFAGVNYGGEYSTNLQTWTPMSDTGTPQVHEFLTPVELIGTPRLFVRWILQLGP